MAGFEDLMDPDFNQVSGADFTFIDADTVTRNGQNYRLRGVNAPEVYHDRDGKRFQEVGGQMTTDQVIHLANEMGFTELIETTDPTGQTEDQFGRKIGDLVNPTTGESFSRALSRHGITSIHPDFDPSNEALKSREYTAALRTNPNYEMTEWDQARDMIAQSVLEEQQYVNQFKQAQNFSGEIGYIDQAIREAEEAGDMNTVALLKRRRGQFNEFAKASLELTDRDQVTGDSNNPFSTAWDTGWLGVADAMGGALNLIGDRTGWEGLEEYGEALSYGKQKNISDQASILVDYKDVDGFWDAVQYVSNNAAISVPYMAISAAGAVLAPVTYGASLAAPAAIYTGQTWNEMEGEKSASVAIGAGVAQAALDRLGLGFIAGKVVGPKKMLNEAVTYLTKNGMSKEVAEATVAKATRQELAGFIGDAATVAKGQLAAKEVFRNLATRAAIGSSGEAVTEGLQEATAYLGATLGSDKVFDYNELIERMQAGAVAGAALGGTFAVPGAAYETGAWADVAYRLAPAEAQHQSRSSQYAEEEKANVGYIASVEELSADARARSMTRSGPTLDERADHHRSQQKGRDAWTKVVDTALAVPALWRGATRQIFTPDVQERSRSARILADMFGANLQRIFSGSSFENSKHHRVAQYKNMVPIPQNVYAALSGGRRLTRKTKAAISQQVYNTLQGAIDPTTNQFNPDLIPDGPNKQLIVQLGNDLQVLSDKMWEDQRKHDPDLGYQPNYLFRYKSLSKRAVADNKQKFIQALMDRFNFSRDDAKRLTDEILDNPEVADIDDAFSVTTGGIVPGSHRQRSLDLSEQDEFQDFMEQDLFANVANAAKSAARYTAHRDFIGQDGAVISQLLDDMLQETGDAALVNKIAAQLKDYLDAESGNYKRPTSDAGKSAMRIQKNFMMFTTLAGLPLATVSSFVESALSMRALTVNQIFGERGSMVTLAKELVNTLWTGANEVTNLAIQRDGEAGQVFKTDGKELLRDLGYYEWDVGAATVTGVTETNPLQQQIYEQFFKWTGLQGWTNYTRAVRASIAGDYIFEKVEAIAQSRLSGEVKTRQVAQDEEALRNLGIDVDGVVTIYDAGMRGIPLTPEQEALMESTFREGTFNFVNDAVALPQSANRPLIYQDPRFALFTQFQGFMATFTANHIPKLWGEYVKRGTPAMKYNAFALMSTMIMLGFASQYLKDLIKYGGRTPYLDDAEYLQRGIRASGLLGTSERVLDQFFPMYEQRSDDAGEWIFNETTGQSPALSNLKRLGRAGGKLLEGDVGEAARLTAKSSPGLGPFNRFTDAIGDAASEWNFKGE